MRILVTNDDGINAAGLKVLEAIAAEVAGDDGEVWTVAPAFEQSGVAHAIGSPHPARRVEPAQRRFARRGRWRATPRGGVRAADERRGARGGPRAAPTS